MVVLCVVVGGAGAVPRNSAQRSKGTPLRSRLPTTGPSFRRRGLLPTPLIGRTRTLAATVAPLMVILGWQASGHLKLDWTVVVYTQLSLLPSLNHIIQHCQSSCTVGTVSLSVSTRALAPNAVRDGGPQELSVIAIFSRMSDFLLPCTRR